MTSLKGLVLKPKLKTDNIVSISNNFNDFIKANNNLKESNIIIKILRTMCDDAEKGICHNQTLYIFYFRVKLRKFILWVLLGSHIPLFIYLFIDIMPFTEIIKYQVCCYVLIYILEMVLQYKHAKFTKIFYSNWYDKILNFDLLNVNMIRNDIDRIKKLSNSHDLLEAVDKFTVSNNQLSKELSSHTIMLSARLDDFINIQQKANGINAQTVILSLDDCIKKSSEIYENMRNISMSIDNSLNSLITLSKLKNDDINVINKNTNILSDIRDRFKTYQNEVFPIELAHLQKIADSLENNISKTFVSIDSAITQNISRLEVGYDKFFDMCKTLSELMSDKYEENTISILTLLCNNFISEFISIKERLDKLTVAITGTSDATKILCETVYEFTQYTMSPKFMERISGYMNFSNKLKDATNKLVSYQKLAELGVVINKQENSDSGKHDDSVNMNNGVEAIK
jgi:hypothetical protein